MEAKETALLNKSNGRHRKFAAAVSPKDDRRGFLKAQAIVYLRGELVDKNEQENFKKREDEEEALGETEGNSNEPDNKKILMSVSAATAKLVDHKGIPKSVSKSQLDKMQ